MSTWVPQVPQVSRVQEYHEYHKYHEYHGYRSTTSTKSTGVPRVPQVPQIPRVPRVPCVPRVPGALCGKTKILTDTETLYSRQIFPMPIPRLFFQYRYRDFFSETKFSNIDTETFLTRPNILISIPILFFRDQIFQYRKFSSVSRLRPRLRVLHMIAKF